jgi:hypothetical protein
LFFGEVTEDTEIAECFWPVTIYSYPRVCLAALEWLKTEVLKGARQRGGESLALPFQAGMADNPLAPARHSDDFRSVHWFGQDYSFTKTQAPCVEVLWKNWENGTPEVGNLAILQAAKSDQNRLQGVFKQKGKMHPAWREMIVPCSTNKGAYRLQEPRIPVSKSPRKSPR